MRRLMTIGTIVGALALAAVAPATVTELGAPADRPAASCPADCQAIGQVSGFQVRQGDREHPYRVRRYGKVVAFSITLGKPRADQVKFFTELFGGAPKARISILRPGAKRRYRLTGQSELFDLASYFGSTPTFALKRPLTMKKDYVAALTVPTWAPAFAVGLGGREAWRSSRSTKACDDVRQPAAQQRLTSLRTYGCLYRTARLLYSVTFVPDPKPTTRRRSS